MFWITASLVLILSIIFFSVYYGITPMPTSGKVKKILLDHLPDDFMGNIYELGAGWGSLAIPLARKFPNKRVIAIEGSPFPCFICWLRKVFCRLSNLYVVIGNFHKKDLTDVGLVVCYLYPLGMQNLKMQLWKSKGSFIVSHTFSMPGWIPKKKIEVNDLYRTTVYIYKI